MLSLFTLNDSIFSVTKLLIVDIPIRLLNIVLFNKPTEFLTARYLGDKFFWKKNAIRRITGIGRMDIRHSLTFRYMR